MCHFAHAKIGKSFSIMEIITRAAHMTRLKNLPIRLVIRMIGYLKKVWCARISIKVFKDFSSIRTNNILMTVVDEFFMLGEIISDETSIRSIVLKSGFIN